MMQFEDRNGSSTLKTKLDEIKHQIEMALFSISKVVDDGNFHVVLVPLTQTELTLAQNIPVCCKISLER